MSFLTLSNVSASYGASQALFDVSLSVEEGQALALLGRNGMGKTTTVRAITRMLASKGTIEFDGKDLQKLPSYKAAQLGIGLVPEGRRCFYDLTVAENMIATARPGHWTMKEVVELFPRLGERKKQIASSLSGGEQQMLAIGRALMTNPRLLVLDEATEGLAPIIRQEIWAAINALKAQTGMSIILVDKTLKELARVCDQAVILKGGRTVWTGAMSEVTSDVAEAYIGINSVNK